MNADPSEKRRVPPATATPIRVDLGADGQDHNLDPEEQSQVAMTRRRPARRPASSPPGAPPGGPAGALPDGYVMIGMIRIATMFATLIMGLIAGPAVSLNGSPTVSPVTDAACASEPLPPEAPSSISFFALSQAPPPAVMRTAKKKPTTMTPISRPPSARVSMSPTMNVMTIGISDDRIISRWAALVTRSTDRA